VADSILSGNRFPDKPAHQFKTAGAGVAKQPVAAQNDYSGQPREGSPFNCHEDKLPCITTQCPKWVEVEGESLEQYPYGGYCVSASKDEAVEELAKDAKETLNTVVEMFTTYAPIVKTMVVSWVQKDMMSGKSVVGGFLGRFTEGNDEENDSETEEDKPTFEV